MNNEANSSQPQAEAILLSVLIPVYNGGRYLENLLQLFADAYVSNPASFARVEIIIGNNVSEDHTQKIAESFTARLPMLRPVALTEHLLTAEENVFRCFGLCRGKFTWALGVDDLPNFTVLGQAIQLLEKGDYDFYLFNFATVSTEMLLYRTCNFYMQAHALPVRLADITQRFGIWYTVAGISGQILRTEFVRDYDFKSLVAQTSRIYAHVIAYLLCFKDKKAVVVNLPLVVYKVDRRNLAQWLKTAEKQGVFDEFFWTLGYVRQLRYLEEANAISDDFLKYMLETSPTSFYRPAYMVAEKLANQVRIMSTTTNQRNHISKSEFEEVSQYLIKKEPFVREYIWKLRDIFDKVLRTEKISSEEWRHLTEQGVFFRDYLPASLLQCVTGDYEIYRIARRYYAVHRQSRSALVERLGYLDNDESPPEVFAGTSIEDVRGKMTAYLQNPENRRPIASQPSAPLTQNHQDDTLRNLIEHAETSENRAFHDKRNQDPLRKLERRIRKIRRGLFGGK